jgi:hypothetical protein
MKNQRTNPEFEYKSQAMSVKDVDTKSGIVTGYFAAFGNIDSGYDKIVKGAFKKTIAERGPEGSKQIKHLLQHDSWTPVGFIQMLKEDSHGLYFESLMSKTPKAQDTLLQYQEGIFNEHSIGYRVIKEEVELDANENFVCYKLLELKLWEGSTVTWGMNSLTPFTGFKTENRAEQIEELSKRMKRCTAALKVGSLSDETLEQMEIELLKLDEAYKSLITEQPIITAQPNDELKALRELNEIFI